MAPRMIKPPAALAPRNANERLVTLDDSGFPYESLKELSCFAKALPDALRTFPGAIIVRWYQKSEVICHQDEPGYTAFYVLKKAEIEKLTQLGRLPPLGNLAGWRADAVLSVHKQVGEKRQVFRVDMSEGDIFGEMSCLSRIPRTATVQAEHDCYVLEFMSNVFTAGRLKAQVEDKVVGRILELHLRGVELFNSANLDPQRYLDIVEKLKQRLGISKQPAAPPAPPTKAEKFEFLQERKHDHLLFGENDRPDGLYIIRLGMVKIVKNASPLLGRDDIVDWPAFEAKLCAEASEKESRLRGLQGKLPADLWAKLDDARAAASKTAWLDEQQEVLYALNDLLKLKDFHTRIQFQFNTGNPLEARMEQEAKTLKDGKSLEEIVRLRSFNRRLLEMILGATLRPFGASPPRTLAIRSSRDSVFAAGDPDTGMAESSLIGEMGLFENKPRSATCVVYCHPEAKFGETHLFYIPKDLFTDLLDPQHIRNVMATRQQSEQSRLRLSVWQESANAQRFEELGLMQGQKLMLIDLDRCTRCDKCVEACVTTHSPPGMLGRLVESILPASLLSWTPFGNTGPRDGRSRLFLDGPRIQIHDEDGTRNYLVPATCRQCKDPVCLVGCPVGSIHKGPNGQIVIEDWCIGCTKCATNCPYNSIQMHPIGVIPQSSAGWWHGQGAGPATPGATPFLYNRELAETHQAAEPVQFTLDFDVSKAHTVKSKAFLLHLESAASKVKVTVNQQVVELRSIDAKEASQKGWNWEAMLAHVDEEAAPMVPGIEERPPLRCLRLGVNRICVEIALADAKYGEVVLNAGLTGYMPPVVAKSVAGEEYVQEWVTRNAVVCDMCSGQFGQQPACVTACPHEAAERRYVTHDSFMPSTK